MNPKITLIGLGNILLRDEGVGVRAVRALLERYETPPGLEAVDGGTAGLDHLPFIEGRDRVLFVDAVNFGQEPGYFGELKNEEIPAFFAVKSCTTWAWRTSWPQPNSWRPSPPEICLIGIQPQALELGLELSAALQARFNALLEKILGKLRDWGISCPLRPAS